MVVVNFCLLMVIARACTLANHVRAARLAPQPASSWLRHAHPRQHTSPCNHVQYLSSHAFIRSRLHQFAMMLAEATLSSSERCPIDWPQQHVTRRSCSAISGSASQPGPKFGLSRTVTRLEGDA